MKTKLLQKLRRRASKEINILSVTKTNGIVTGMSIGFDDDCYKGLFEFGDSEDVILKKAEHIYITNYLKEI